MAEEKLTKYSPEELSHFEQIILKEKNRLLEKLDKLSSAAMETSNKETGGESGYSLHMADQGTDAQEREKSYLFASRERKYLDKLNEALDRIKDGSYGICRQCNSKIAKERLEAVPVTRLCYECKSKQY